jgi:hypothetical protein
MLRDILGGALIVAVSSAALEPQGGGYFELGCNQLTRGQH